VQDRGGGHDLFGPLVQATVQRRRRCEPYASTSFLRRPADSDVISQVDRLSSNIDRQQDGMVGRMRQFGAVDMVCSWLRPHLVRRFKLSNDPQFAG
jgi:hypothetical protein